jgi:hypothetical protein
MSLYLPQKGGTILPLIYQQSEGLVKQGEPWNEIGLAFFERSEGTLQVRYSAISQVMAPGDGV